MSPLKIFIIIFVSSLIILRVFAPWLGKKYVNYVLSTKLEHYTGSIDDFDLFILGGEYTLGGFKLYKKTVPEIQFVAMKKVNISLNWNHLLKGKLLMDIAIDRGVVNFVDGKNEQRDVSGSEEDTKNWKEALDEIVPLSIQRLNVTNSSVALQIGVLKNLVASQLIDINLRVTNLVDPQKQKAKLSPFKFKGLLNGHAPLAIEGGVNIVDQNIPFDVNGSIDKFNISSTNNLLRHYIPIDAQKGSLDAVFEVYGAVSEGKGYIKTFFDGLELFKIDQKYISTKHIIFEWLGGFANWLINAMTEGEVATEIPFLWTPAGFDVDSSEAFWKLIENTGENLKKEPKLIGPLDSFEKKTKIKKKVKKT